MSNKQKNFKEGISLIVLVITIIVMIILAGAVIITINNTNIIDDANLAVDETNLNNVKTIASLAWGEAYVDGKKTQADLEIAVTDALRNNNIEPTDYVIEVTTSGVSVRSGWQYVFLPENDNKLVVTNGKHTLKIGSVINYTAPGTTYTGDWRILGAEDGNLLIVSRYNIANSVALTGREDYKNVETKLDALCAPYSGGKSAISARSLRVEDVNKVTGYNPNNVGVYDPLQTGRGTVYSNYDYSYGEDEIYTLDGTGTVNYTGTHGSSTALSKQHTIFYWYDIASAIWKQTTTGTVTLNNTNYNYYPTTLNDGIINGVPTGENVGIDSTSEAYKMLFVNGAGIDVCYWLASRILLSNSEDIQYNIYLISNSWVNQSTLAYSDGTERTDTAGVRAVVTLPRNIKLTGSNLDGWSY